MTEAELLLATEGLSGVGGWAFDAGAGRLHWTPQAFRLHGLAPGVPQPEWSQALALLVPDDGPRVQALVTEVLAQGRRAEIGVRLRPQGGQSQRLLLVAEPWPGVAGGVRGSLRSAGPESLPETRILSAQSSISALAAAGVGVFESDLDTGHSAWSDRMMEIHGLAPGAALPSREQWRTQFVHPEDLDRVNAGAAALIAEGRAYELDMRIHRASDGALRWLHTRAALPRGDRRHVLGITIDITERKLAEELAQDALHGLDVSASQVGFGLGYRNLHDGHGEWSPQLKRLFGLAADAPTPSREGMLALLEEHDRERMRRELWVPTVVGEVREIEYRVPLPDGSVRVLISRTVTRADAAGRPWRLYFVVIDLSETRARDRQVAELLERMQMATEATGVGTWERDPDAPHAIWDDTTRALFGLPAGVPAPVGPDYLALIHPDDRARVAAQMRASDTATGHFEMQFRVPLPGGGVRWLLTRGRAHHDAEGRVVRRSGICFDITERHQAEGALQAKELAERANAAKTEFLSRMSHELRTPLNAVLGFAQLLMLDAAQPLSEAQRARVAHIQNAGWHLLALINDVLDLTRIESRQAQLQPELLPLNEVVDECLAMHTQAAAQRGILLQPLRDAGSPTTLWADRTRFKQVLLNLLSNAIKYNRDGGWVQVSARALPGNEVQVSVRDSGPGLSAPQQAQLFEPFNRLGRERGPVEGTGIGLALSRLIAEQMGGRLDAQSEVGVGSEFQLTLPAAPP